MIVAVNNDDADASMSIPAACDSMWSIVGRKVSANGGRINATVKGNSGKIWIPSDSAKTYESVEITIAEKTTASAIKKEAAPAPKEEAVPETKPKKTVKVPKNKSYEEMIVVDLQQCILEKMRKNGPVTERMAQDVYENTHHGALETWAKSFW